MKITTIYESVEGEAKDCGELSIFIRTYGCSCQCWFCDARKAWEEGWPYTEMSVSEIIEKCKTFGATHITFTGGEPLLQEDADELIDALVENGYVVDIETNGSVDFTQRPWFTKYSTDQVWICTDYKCPGSLMEDHMVSWDTFTQLREGDVIKFVVGSQEDLNRALEVITYCRDKGCNCYMYLGPVYGQIEPTEIVDFMKEHKMAGKIRLQIQIQKVIFSNEDNVDV